ncbi:Protein Smaug [Eumeta japonica]|uniref:Protein Smaug n=1 Tax=Eumeta variegata TaxID=151549 RepID=A0A4C1UDV5_EUMVA|nr:Protein Smaug [Eumeta japonica]
MSTFYEQLGSVTGVFEQWGTCERTVVLCALARRVPWAGLKLLQRAVEAALARDAPATADGELLEREANDESVLNALLAATKADTDDCDEEQLRRLVSLLPLLRVDNERAKQVYVNAAPILVQRCVDGPRRRNAELCRQLLSYLLVHPALTNHDQQTLKQWLWYLENHMCGNGTSESNLWQAKIEPGLLYSSNNSNIWAANNSFRRTIGKNVEFRGLVDPPKDAYNTDPLQESFSQNGRDVDISIESDKLSFDLTIGQPKSQRSNSLTPPSSAFMHMSSSAENLSDEAFVQKPRSFSLSSEHSLGQLRPISIMYGTTGSETRLDDLRSNNFVAHPGMSTVAQWLKSLRLHKYIWLFSNISYEQMMAMDEEYLENLGVTKGARHKLLLSIGKLRERNSTLSALETELRVSPAPASTAMARLLERLRGLLLSPMPPSSDFPARIVRVLELASKILLTGSCAPTLRVPAFQSHIYDDCTSIDHDFNVVDPVSLHCWLVEKALHHESFSSSSELTEALKRMRHRLPPRQFFHHVSDTPHNRGPKPRWRTHPHNGWTKNGGTGKKSWAPPPPRPKSHSYPPYPAPRAPRPPALRMTSHTTAPTHAIADIDSSLDALCLQMTEQAIN